MTETDMQIVRACAEACGVELSTDIRCNGGTYIEGIWPCEFYWPLTNREQCFALIEQFPEECLLSMLGAWAYFKEKSPHSVMKLDLQRAACLYVARMHLARKGEK
jgi:hypothetical protein